jgi:hypothetical protein
MTGRIFLICNPFCFANQKNTMQSITGLEVELSDVMVDPVFAEAR